MKSDGSGSAGKGNGQSARERAERSKARRRAAARAEQRGAAPGADREVHGGPLIANDDPRVGDLAFRALAENVRDYAIFLMNPQGIITFWGEGARLMKWWTKEEAEGAHLCLLYPDGGSDD